MPFDCSSSCSLLFYYFYEEITKIILQLSSNMINYTLYLFFCKTATVLKFQTPKMFVVISLECRLRDNCPAGVDEPANSADPDQTALRTASLGAVCFSRSSRFL